MLRTLPAKDQNRGTQNPGQAMDESVASSWAYAVKATLAPLGAYAALTAPTPPLLGHCRLAGKRRVLGLLSCLDRWRSR